MEPDPFQPGCLGTSAAQSNLCSFTPPGALVAAAAHPGTPVHPGGAQGGGGSRALEPEVNSSPSSPMRLTKPQAISVLLLGEMENRGQGERATVVLNGRLNSQWGQDKAYWIY